MRQTTILLLICIIPSMVLSSFYMYEGANKSNNCWNDQTEKCYNRWYFTFLYPIIIPAIIILVSFHTIHMLADSEGRVFKKPKNGDVK